MNEEIVGMAEGDICNRNACQGTIDIHPSYNCSCHINPPCSSCTDPRAYCPKCQWEEANDEIFNDHVVQVDQTTGNYKWWGPRPLNTEEIDWRSESHTHSSMKKIGCYPKGTTMEQVEKLVVGTFGGRFNYFGEGKFEYVAYTD